MFLLLWKQLWAIQDWKAHWFLCSCALLVGVDGVVNQDGQSCRKSFLSTDSKQFLPPDFTRRWIAKRATVSIIYLASYGRCRITHHVIADDPCDCDAVVEALGSIVGRGVGDGSGAACQEKLVFCASRSDYYLCVLCWGDVSKLIIISSLTSFFFLFLFVLLFGHDCSALPFLLGDYFSEAASFSLRSASAVAAARFFFSSGMNVSKMKFWLGLRAIIYNHYASFDKYTLSFLRWLCRLYVVVTHPNNNNNHNKYY